MKESSMFTPELSFKISLLCFLCLFVANSFLCLLWLPIPVLQAFDDAQHLRALLLEEREHEDDRGSGHDSRDIP